MMQIEVSRVAGPLANERNGLSLNLAYNLSRTQVNRGLLGAR